MAIPSKGRLKDPAEALFEQLNVKIPLSKNLFIRADGFEILRANARDIPLFISEGVADCGITGLDILEESQLGLKDILDLKFGSCDLVLAGQRNKTLKNGSRIGTVFPNITCRYFSKLGLAPKILSVTSAAENLPAIGLCDFIVDLSSTGQTLRENNLVVYDLILSSTARLVCKRKKPCVVEFAKKLSEVLK